MAALSVRLAVMSLLVLSVLACSNPSPRPAEPTTPPSRPTAPPPAATTAAQPTTALADRVADVVVTNVRENAFAVSWLTDQPMTGVVRFGLEGGEAQGSVAEKPVAGASGLVHYVSLGHDTGATLAPEKRYWFEIITADGGRPLYRGGLTTARMLDFPPAAGSPIFGKIEGATGAPARGAVVLASVKSAAGISAPLSNVANERGEWSLVLRNARVLDLSQLQTFQCGDKLELQILGGPANRAALTADVCARPPLPAVILP